MYHPCAPTEIVQRLRSLARGCLWKHLIFAFRGDFTEDHPVALVSYGTILKVGLDKTLFCVCLDLHNLYQQNSVYLKPMRKDIGNK